LQPFSLPVQWVEKFSSNADTTQGRRVFWGRIASGAVQIGQRVTVQPGGKNAVVAEVLNHARMPTAVCAGQSAGIILDRELDVSRGDVLLASEGFDEFTGQRELTVTVAWMDDEPLLPGRLYWALQGHRWVKAKVKRIVHQVNIQTLAQQPASQLEANAIGVIELALQAPLVALPFAHSRTLGALVLVDTASHKTSGAALILSAREG
jgi:sulfate adenylyltransferase subunit 1